MRKIALVPTPTTGGKTVLETYFILTAFLPAAGKRLLGNRTGHTTASLKLMLTIRNSLLLHSVFQHKSFTWGRSIHGMCAKTISSETPRIDATVLGVK